MKEMLGHGGGTYLHFNYNETFPCGRSVTMVLQGEIPIRHNKRKISDACCDMHVFTTETVGIND